jgi:hypothetical protein
MIVMIHHHHHHQQEQQQHFNSNHYHDSFVMYIHSCRRYHRGRVEEFQTELLHVALRSSHSTAGMKWIDDGDDDDDDDEWDEMDGFY